MNHRLIFRNILIVASILYIAWVVLPAMQFWWLR